MTEHNGMNHFYITLFSSLWLGILTSISPCPLASNIAAISFISKKIIHTRIVLWSGIFYTVGRMVTYAVLGFILIYSLLGIPAVANFLQKYINKALGPILIIAGLFILDIFKFNIPSLKITNKMRAKIIKSGIFGSFFLGIIFALSFCPISAALFFGSLIPLSLSSKYGLILPFFYGIGTGLPVLVFSILISSGVKSISKFFNKLMTAEKYARRVTGIIFIVIGIYYILTRWLV